MRTFSSANPEARLIPILKDNFLLSVFDKKVISDKYSVGEEFRSQYGIPDLLFYNFDDNVIKTRIRNKLQPVLSKEIIKTLLLIQGKKKITLSFLQANLPFNQEIIKNKVIKYLLQNNYLNKSINSCESYWVGDNIYKSCMSNLFAIEAKISNWKRGFYQAYRYKWFSHYSFLALQKKHARPAIKNLTLFKEHNVGLITVDTNNNLIDLIFHPKKQAPYSNEIASLTFERLFANYLEKKADSQLAQSSRLII